MLITTLLFSIVLWRLMRCGVGQLLSGRITMRRLTLRGGRGSQHDGQALEQPPS